MDARCLLRAIDAVAARKSLKQAWIFSASHTITPPGSCIHRKAINKDKPSCPLEVSVLPRIGRIRLREERDQKVSVGLGGIPPWVFRHRSLLKTSLGSTLWRNSQSCLAGPSKPPENKIAAVGSTKRLPWSHNDILRLVRGAPVLWISILPRIRRIGRIGLRILGARQKPNKPLAVDARCLLRAFDVVAARKTLKQAWIFSASHTITPPGSCIHRKAINKNKPSLYSGVLPSRQQSCVCRLPGTPPPSVYQVTQCTALLAAECL